NIFTGFPLRLSFFHSPISLSCLVLLCLANFVYFSFLPSFFSSSFLQLTRTIIDSRKTKRKKEEAARAWTSSVPEPCKYILLLLLLLLFLRLLLLISLHISLCSCISCIYIHIHPSLSICQASRDVKEG
ncbi:hypothetical protein CSUI_009801, partial [Cystoisospora suis]